MLHGESHLGAASQSGRTNAGQIFTRVGAVADISEVGRSAQAYTELSCRTTPMCSDVSMALINMGTSRVT